MLFYKTFSTAYGQIQFQNGQYNLPLPLSRFLGQKFSNTKGRSADEQSILKLYSAQQVHGSKVSVIKKSQFFYPDSDGLITHQKNLILSIRHADCVPLIIFDPVKKNLALIHSGWQGTRDQIGLKALHLMTKHFASNPKDCLIKILPSAQKCCYRFSLHWPHMSLTYNPKWQKYIIKKRHYYYLNLQGYINNMFIKAGIRPNNIKISSACTICQHRYHSWTRQRQLQLPAQNNLTIACLT